MCAYVKNNIKHPPTHLAAARALGVPGEAEAVDLVQHQEAAQDPACVYL